jgi:hypothetical protein
MPGPDNITTVAAALYGYQAAVAAEERMQEETGQAPASQAAAPDDPMATDPDGGVLDSTNDNEWATAEELVQREKARQADCPPSWGLASQAQRDPYVRAARILQAFTSTTPLDKVDLERCAEALSRQMKDSPVARARPNYFTWASIYVSMTQGLRAK